jgi:hypothetical protein
VFLLLSLGQQRKENNILGPGIQSKIGLSFFC